MKSRTINRVLMIATSIIFSACSKNESKKPTYVPPPAIVEELSDKEGNCTEGATVSFVEVNQKISAYEQDSTIENLTEAGKSCDKMKSLIGENSCKMKMAEPQIQLDKNLINQICSRITDKIISNKEEDSNPEIALDTILNSEFSSSKEILVNLISNENNNLNIKFSAGEKNENGIAFESNITCGYVDSVTSMYASHSTQTAYNKDKTIIKTDGNVVRICNGSEVKVGSKIKNVFSFKAGYCNSAGDFIENANIEIKLLEEDKIKVNFTSTAFIKLNCTGELKKQLN